MWLKKKSLGQQEWQRRMQHWIYQRVSKGYFHLVLSRRKTKHSNRRISRKLRMPLRRSILRTFMLWTLKLQDSKSLDLSKLLWSYFRMERRLKDTINFICQRERSQRKQLRSMVCPRKCWRRRVLRNGLRAKVNKSWTFSTYTKIIPLLLITLNTIVMMFWEKLSRRPKTWKTFQRTKDGDALGSWPKIYPGWEGLLLMRCSSIVTMNLEKRMDYMMPLKMLNSQELHTWI